MRKGRRRYKPHCPRFLCFGRKSPRVERKQTPAWLQITLKGDYNVIKDTLNRVKGRITLNKKKTDCWIKKGQELNRHFPKMTNQSVNEHVKRCLTSLVLRAKQIGTPIEITAYPRSAKRKKTTVPSVGGHLEQLGLSVTAGGRSLSKTALENHLIISDTTKHVHAMRPSTFTPKGICSLEDLKEIVYSSTIPNS